MDDNLQTFEMDGSEHIFPAEISGCCQTYGKVCKECGGWCHYQPVYGGYYFECEKCHNVSI